MSQFNKIPQGFLKYFVWICLLTIFWMVYLAFGANTLIFSAKIGTALTALLMTYLALDKVFDQSKFSNRIWKWFDSKKWLHWYADPKNGMMKIVLFLGAFVFPVKLLLEQHWNYINPDLSAQAYSLCEGGWHWKLSEVLWSLYFVAVVAWFVIRDFGLLVIDFAKADPARISQHLIWQLALFLTITSIGITALEPHSLALEKFRDNFIIDAAKRCE